MPRDCDHKCQACGVPGMREFLEWRQVPVHQNFHIPTLEQALSCTRGDIVLAICESCKFISNLAFSTELLQYQPGHDASQDHSAYFSNYLKNLVEGLIERHGLRDKSIVEIGCGQGEFLSLLCEAGGNRGVGFDPSIGRWPNRHSPNVKFISDFYTEQSAAEYPADCICCRHTLEHLPRPAEMVGALRAALGTNHDTAIYFELPTIEWILANDALWALTYGHCSWFCPESLTNLFRINGFDVQRVEETFDREYLSLEAFPRGGVAKLKSSVPQNRLSDISGAATEFGARFQANISRLKTQLDDVRKRSSRYVLWGAGGKGSTVLNILGLQYNEMEFVIDINPTKQGGYISGTGQRVVPLEDMVSYQPEVVLVTNPLYVPEMRTALQKLDLNPEMVVLA